MKYTILNVFFFRFGLDCPNVSIAYSPTSPVLEDVVRNAITNLLIQNMEDLIARLPIEIELPPTIEINSTAILDWIKSRIRVQAYNNSHETRGIYIEEENTRRVIAVVEFDDKLYGWYCIIFPIRACFTTSI